MSLTPAVLPAKVKSALITAQTNYQKAVAAASKIFNAGIAPFKDESEARDRARDSYNDYVIARSERLNRRSNEAYNKFMAFQKSGASADLLAEAEVAYKAASDAINQADPELKAEYAKLLEAEEKFTHQDTYGPLFFQRNQAVQAALQERDATVQNILAGIGAMELPSATLDLDPISLGEPTSTTVVTAMS